MYQFKRRNFVNVKPRLNPDDFILLGLRKSDTADKDTHASAAVIVFFVSTTQPESF